MALQVNRAALTKRVESPEPSVDGDWYVLDLQDLIKEGFRFIEIHISEAQDTPDAMAFLEDPS